MPRDVDELVRALRSTFGDFPDFRYGWPGEADTALIDAVFSARAKYQVVVRPLVERWRASDLRDARRQLASLAELDLSNLLNVVENRQRVPGSNPNRPLKAQAVIDAAARLTAESLATADMVVQAAEQDGNAVRRIVEGRNVKGGARTGIGLATSSYFLMLLGVRGVKADTHVIRWVSRAIREDAPGSGQSRGAAVGRGRCAGREPDPRRPRDLASRIAPLICNSGPVRTAANSWSTPTKPLGEADIRVMNLSPCDDLLRPHPSTLPLLRLLHSSGQAATFGSCSRLRGSRPKPLRAPKP
jgi:hypothetical protein